MFPVGAEIYWALKEWRLLGFANIYTLPVIGYSTLWATHGMGTRRYRKTRGGARLSVAVAAIPGKGQSTLTRLWTKSKGAFAG
jgi:hypothetical protein